MKKKLIAFPIVICFLLALGCQHKSEKFISEGCIEYSVKVLNGEGNMMAEMIPAKMILKFRNNKSCATMSAEMGLFAVSFIANPETNTNTVCMKLLNKKMVAVQNTFDIERENNEFQYDFIPSNETKMIAGYKCYKVHVKPKKRNWMNLMCIIQKNWILKIQILQILFIRLMECLWSIKLKNWHLN
jgi:hypothetical protein